MEVPTSGSLFDPRLQQRLVYLSVSLLQPHFPRMHYQFALLLDSVSGLLRLPWTWCVKCSVVSSCSHVNRYHGVDVQVGVEVQVYPFSSLTLDLWFSYFLVPRALEVSLSRPPPSPRVAKLFRGIVWSSNTVELQLSGLKGTANQLDTQKFRVIELFFENGLYWQFVVRLLLFTECACV
jgi:hypothetical protein